MPRLDIVSGPDTGLSIEIVHRFTVLGRQKGCEIVLDDTQASRKHTKISHINGKFVIEDLDSRNFTFVNGQKITKQELKDGDEIIIGNTTLRFLDVAEIDDKGKVLEPILASRKVREVDISKVSIRGYEILDLIGKGGMGFVCRARQLSMDRIVAIKILHEKFVNNPEFVARFISEARAAGKLNHPNVIQVHDVGQYNNVYFFSMEYLDGKSVHQLLRDKKTLPITEATRIVLEIARALDFAHKHHIVHRDVKPDNIMVTPDGKVKLADLGISKVFDETRTASNIVLGSPHYMSPEQAMGGRVDGRADIYSLGSTFYHMVVGDTPYTGVSVSEILNAQVAAPPPNMKSVAPHVPNRIGNVIRRMLAKSPEDRYPNARELIIDLEKIYDKLAPKRTIKADLNLKKLAQEKVRESSKRRNLILAIATGVVLLVAAALYFALRSPYEPPKVTGSGAPVASKTPVATDILSIPEALQDKFAEFNLLVLREDLEKARELGDEILEKWPEYTTYTKQVRVELDNVNRKITAKVLAELGQVFNQFVVDLLNQSLEQRLMQITKFREDNAKTFAKYGEESECKRVITELNNIEARTKREYDKAVENALENLKRSLDNHIANREFFSAEQKLMEFKVMYNTMYGAQIESLLKKLTQEEEKHFREIISQSEGEASKNRISLAIVILKGYIKAQEGRPYVAQARESLSGLASKLDATWGRAVKNAEIAERDFKFGEALREYDSLKRQVDLDEDRLKEINRLILLTKTEYSLFGKLRDAIKSKAPIKLKFDITGFLKDDYLEWSIIDADDERIGIKNTKGVGQEIKWSAISGSSLEKLMNSFLSPIKAKEEVLALARMLRLKGEVTRADDLETSVR